MSDPTSMQVIKAFCDLLKESPADRLFDDSVGAHVLDILMKRDALNVVHNNADLLLCLYQVMHPDDVWVVDLLQGHDLALNSFSLHAVVQFGFLIDFDCIFFHVTFVVASVNHSICSLADWLANLVGLECTATWHLGT